MPKAVTLLTIKAKKKKREHANKKKDKNMIDLELVDYLKAAIIGSSGKKILQNQ